MTGGFKLVIPRGAIQRTNKHSCLEDACHASGVSVRCDVQGATLGALARAVIASCFAELQGVASIKGPNERKRALLDALLAQWRRLSTLARLVGWSEWLEEAALAVSGIEAAYGMLSAGGSAGAALGQACVAATHALRPAADVRGALECLAPHAETALDASPLALMRLPLSAFPMRQVEAGVVALSCPSVQVLLGYSNGDWRIDKIDAPSAPAASRLREHFLSQPAAHALAPLRETACAMSRAIALGRVSRELSTLSVRQTLKQDAIEVSGANLSAAITSSDGTLILDFNGKTLSFTAPDASVALVDAIRAATESQLPPLANVAVPSVLGTPVTIGADSVTYGDASAPIRVGPSVAVFNGMSIPTADAETTLVAAMTTWALSVAEAEHRRKPALTNAVLLRASASEMAYGWPLLPGVVARAGASGWTLDFCGTETVPFDEITIDMISIMAQILSASGISCERDGDALRLVNWPLPPLVRAVSLHPDARTVSIHPLTGSAASVPLDEALPLPRAIDRAVSSLSHVYIQ